jgi:type VI protein secretion system component VasF
MICVALLLFFQPPPVAEPQLRKQWKKKSQKRKRLNLEVVWICSVQVTLAAVVVTIKKLSF